MDIVILFTMIFCHIVDDYYLQGWLASGKQKDWWKKQGNNPLYENDYIIALICHSFSWSFMINLPLMLYLLYTNNFNPIFYSISIVVNMVIHAIVDNLKANVKTINLIQDQSVHFIQIAITFLIFI